MPYLFHLTISTFPAQFSDNTMHRLTLRDEGPGELSALMSMLDQSAER